MRFYDREKEICILKENEQQSKHSAVFTVLRGRMRVGKTTLLKTALKGCDYAYLPVTNDNEEILCQLFQKTLEEKLAILIDGAITKLCDLFEIILRESLNRHFTIILDGVEELYDVAPLFFTKMRKLWNVYHHNSHLHLIISCCIKPPIRHIFEDNNGQLYNCPSTILTLEPFSINTLKHIFKDHCLDYQNEDLLCLFMITGGVPKYVEILMDACCYTKEEMLDYVCRKDSYFIQEGYNIVDQLFGDNGVTYFSVLQLVARSLDSFHDKGTLMQRRLYSYLINLEKEYEIVTCLKPILSNSKNAVYAYEISDQFLRFWFRFIAPYQSSVEEDKMLLVREIIEENYNSFSGRTLEQYFHRQVKESGLHTEVGYWWSREGKSEIDLLALNERNRTGLVAEIKRNSKDIRISKLEEKINALPPNRFGKYTFRLHALSIKDMNGITESIWDRLVFNIVHFLHRIFGNTRIFSISRKIHTQRIKTITD